MTRDPPRDPPPGDDDLLDHLGVIIWRAEADPLRVTSLNRHIEDLLGRPRTELLSNPRVAGRQYIPPDDLAALAAASAEVIAKGIPRTVEHRMVNTLLGDRSFRTEVKPLRLRDGRVVEVCGLMLDVTEERRAEARARESEARLAALVDSLPFDVFAIDVDGRYSLLNAVAREKNWGPAVGTRPEDAPVPPDVRARWIENNRRAMAGEVVRGEVVFTVNGEPRTFFNVIAPIHDQGQVRGILGVNIEVTELRNTERERDRLVDDLRRSLEQLRETQAVLVRKERLAAIGELAAIVAHEVRNPLGAIFNSLGELRKRLPLEGEPAFLFAVLEEEAARLNRIVTDLLDFTRPLGIVAQLESLERLVEEALVAALRAAPSEQVRVERAYQPVPDVLLDQRLMHHAVLNVLTNSLQAMPDGGVLTLAIDRDGPWSRLTVSDTGAGIPSEALARVFEPFFTTRVQGTGLGLSIVKRIVEEHHGTVAVTSEAGRGTRFEIRLPSAESQ